MGDGIQCRQSRDLSKFLAVLNHTQLCLVQKWAKYFLLKLIDANHHPVISQHVYGLHTWDIPLSRMTNSSIQVSRRWSAFWGSKFANKLPESYRIGNTLRPSHFFCEACHSTTLSWAFSSWQDSESDHISWLGNHFVQCLATIIGYSVFCVPKPGQSWLIRTSSYSCNVSSNIFTVVIGVVSVFSDLFVIYIPLPIIWQLHLATRKKVSVSIVFITGFLYASSLHASCHILPTNSDT